MIISNSIVTIIFNLNLNICEGSRWDDSNNGFDNQTSTYNTRSSSFGNRDGCNRDGSGFRQDNGFRGRGRGRGGSDGQGYNGQGHNNQGYNNQSQGFTAPAGGFNVPPPTSYYNMYAQPPPPPATKFGAK